MTPDRTVQNLGQGQIKRRELFEVFAANLQLYCPDVRDTFVCPLCKRPFPRELIDDYLSLAHIVPKRLGGTDCVLTCKDCNNQTGTRFESEVVKEERFANLLSGTGRTNVSLEPEGNVIPAIWDRAPGQHHFTVQDGRETAKLALLNQIQEKGELQIRFRGFNRPNRDRSLLTSALLLAFRQFGYEYILTAAADDVRALLFDDARTRDRIPAGTIPVGVQTVERSLPKLGFMYLPGDLSCFVALIRSPWSQHPIRWVALPGLDDDARGSFRRCMQMDQIGSINGQLRLLRERGLQSLADPAYSWTAHRLWRNRGAAHP